MPFFMDFDTVLRIVCTDFKLYLAIMESTLSLMRHNIIVYVRNYVYIMDESIASYRVIIIIFLRV